MFSDLIPQNNISDNGHDGYLDCCKIKNSQSPVMSATVNQENVSMHKILENLS